MKTQLLLVALLAATPLLRSPSTPAPFQSPTEVRDELAAVGAQWDAARTSFDVAAFERMLAPDFWVQIGSEKIPRAQFIDMISKSRPEARLVRFESRILTLTREKDVWAAVVLEKLEAEVKGADGKTGKNYSLWVTRDRFRKDAQGWTCLSSEALGSESWSGGQVPPFDDWSS